MANVNGGLVSQKQQTQIQDAQQVTVKSLLANINYKKRFEEILGKKAAGFMSSIINVSNSPGLKDCNPNTILSSAVVAATLDLPIDQNLGFAYIVPYNCKEKINGVDTWVKKAQFQMGYKGFIQLAMRSGQYKTISSGPVYSGEIGKYNRITGEIEFDPNFSPENEQDENIVGYIAYFKLLNGFEKYFYMTVGQLQSHGKRYSQSYKSEKQWVRDSSLWATDFQSMATKTVLKLLLSKYGILSIDMQKALETDQATIKDGVLKGEEINENIEYVDNQENIIEAEFTESNPEDKKEESYEGTPFES